MPRLSKREKEEWAFFIDEKPEEELITRNAENASMNASRASGRRWFATRSIKANEALTRASAKKPRDSARGIT